MKTKHLFYSLALASAFAACTQEELVEAPVVKDNVADRPVAGVVEFTFDDAESRYVESTGDFEAGDVFGFYLMDEFVDGEAIDVSVHKAEHMNANGTYWKYQNHWFGMYRFTKSIQSNYPFRAEMRGGEIVWKNDAKLVEGNYFAMFPQNEEALNRRELWHSIDPSKELKLISTTGSERKFLNAENQFFLGYKQIYRDATASAESVLKVNIPMKGVMVPLAFEFEHLQFSEVKLDKISFKNKDGQALPTLAFVDPTGYERAAASNIYGGWVVATNDVAENVYCTSNYNAKGLYNENATWTKQTIMNLVKWEIPDAEGVNTPYGLTNTTKAYEYSFTFPENTIMDSEDVVVVGVVVPAMDYEQWQNLEVDIYAWEKHNGVWEYKVLRPNTNSNVNYTMKIGNELTIWNQANESSYWNRIDVRFDQFAFKAVEKDVLTTETLDMEKAVLGRLAEQKNGPVALTIVPDANGVVVRKAFLDKLIADSKEGRPITLTFSGRRGGSVTFNENNTMLSSTDYTTEVKDYVKFIYDETVTVYNNAEQTVDGSFGTEKGGKKTQLVNGGAAKLNVVSGANIMADVTNNGEMVVEETGKVDVINNSYKLTLKCQADVEKINNSSDAEVIVDAAKPGHVSTAYVGTLNNIGKHGCNTCVRPSVSVISGTLDVDDFNNGGGENMPAILTVAANSAIKVNNELINNSDIDNIGGEDVERTEFVNNGTINGNGTVQNNGTIENYGTLNSTGLVNSNIINARAGHIYNLNQNEGTVNVYGEAVEVYVASNTGRGTVVFKDVVAGHVDNHLLITKVYELAADTDLLTLVTNMFKTGSTQVSTSKNITFNKILKYNGDKDTELVNYLVDKVSRIEVTGSDVIFKNANDCDWEWILPNLDLVVKNGCRLSIMNRMKMTIKTVSGNAHVTDGCQLNGARVDHTDVSKYGNVTTITASTDANSNGEALKNSLKSAGKDDIINLSEGNYTLNANGQSFVTPVVIVGDGDTKISDPYRNRMQFDLSVDGTVVLKNLKIAKEDGTLGTLWIKSNNADYQKFVLENVECASIEYDNGAINSATIDVELKSCKIREIGMIAYNDPATFSNLTYDVSTSIENIIVRGNSTTNNLENIKINGVKPTAFGKQ